MTEAAEPYIVRSVNRAVSLLDAMADADGPVSLTEIAARVGLSVPTVFRLARTLESSGLVMSDGNSKYRLGHRLLELSNALLRHLDLPDQARSALTRVRDRTGESATLVKRVGDIYFHAIIAESHQTLRRVPNVGLPHPLHQSPAGRVFLAFDTEAQIDDYIARTALATDEFAAPVDVDTLRTRLAAIREHDVDEIVVTENLAKVAVPARGFDGAIATAVYISGPSSRFGDAARDEWIAVARDAAREISVVLGHRPQPATS